MLSVGEPMQWVSLLNLHIWYLISVLKYTLNIVAYYTQICQIFIINMHQCFRDFFDLKKIRLKKASEVVLYLILLRSNYVRKHKKPKMTIVS